MLNGIEINWDTKGFDHYLEFQYNRCGDFVRSLFLCLGRADRNNFVRLSRAFPSHAEAYKLYTQVGLKEFAAKCNKLHPLFKSLVEDNPEELKEYLTEVGNVRTYERRLSNGV